MAQRVMIAIALACRPELLIADEPTTALDVTIQAQILDLIRQLRTQTRTAVILVTHDLGVIAEMADRVAVMYAGRIVEEAAVNGLFERPAHPYTQGLIESIPVLGDVKERLNVIPGAVPNLVDLPVGCKFAPRCPARIAYGLDVCTIEEPQLRPVAQNHTVRCWLYHDSAHHTAPLAFAGSQWKKGAALPGVTNGQAKPAAETGRVEETVVPAAQPLLRVEGLVKHFPVRKGLLRRTQAYVQAVDDVSFDIQTGETLGLVGESGCGKTTIGRTILRLIEPTKGAVYFGDRNVFELNKQELKRLRRDMQIIFQDPYSSLNSRMPVGEQIAEGLLIHGIGNANERREMVIDVLRKVGLDDYHARRFPHEFSGGQRQRIGIARALALRPKFIVCDEPVSALDVSIQSQVLNILRELQDEFSLTYLFIAHNLGVVEHISDRVAVMYLGKMVELADRDELYRNPSHPYTQALMSAIPLPDPTVRRSRLILEGSVPSPLNPPQGCRFHTRCPFAMAHCTQEEPPFKEYTPGHWTACWLLE
jgi:peptide/nickel transport system ATP-binding protein